MNVSFRALFSHSNQRAVSLISQRWLAMPCNKYTPVLKEDVSKFFDEGIHASQHPGRRKNPCPQLPYKLDLACQAILNKYKGKKFRADIESIRREFLEVMVKNVEDNSTTLDSIKNIREERNKEQSRTEKEKANTELQNIKKNFFIRDRYSSYQCAAYMAARLPANYAALSYIFHEIQYEEPNFVPSTLFDFGSGVGSTIWAADHYWKDNIKEIFCVDLNENMNELSRELLQKGTIYNDNILDKIFYRQFLPVRHNPSYDLVVSAFSLLEFPDTSSRIHVVENLWKKTSGALVFVEHGSKAGFAAIMEARNFVLQISNKQLDPLRENSTSSQITDNLAKPEGSVIAPCPHDFVCPRLKEYSKKSFCNFAVKYNVMDYGQPNPSAKTEKFAYVVLKKNNSPLWKEAQKNWPRIVEPVAKRSQHAVCRLCTSNGELNEIVVSKNRHKGNLYKSCRNSDWGDKIPVDLFKKIVENSLPENEHSEQEDTAEK